MWTFVNFPPLFVNSFCGQWREILLSFAWYFLRFFHIINLERRAFCVLSILTESGQTKLAFSRSWKNGDGQTINSMKSLTNASLISIRIFHPERSLCWRSPLTDFDLIFISWRFHTCSFGVFLEPLRGQLAILLQCDTRPFPPSVLRWCFLLLPNLNRDEIVGQVVRIWRGKMCKEMKPSMLFFIRGRKSDGTWFVIIRGKKTEQEYFKQQEKKMIKQREIIINTFAIMCHLKQAECINSAIVLLFFEDMVLNQLFKGDL